MNLNWLVKILIGVIISAFLTIILISIWQVLTPLNISLFDNYTPFPNFTPEELPTDVTGITPCESELVSCDINLGCTTCSSDDYECVQPTIDGQYTVAIPGTSDEYIQIPAIDKEKTPNKGYCVPTTPAPTPIPVCNTFTGQWSWEIDPITGGSWECQCRYPEFFGNASGGCIDPLACQVEAFGTLSNVNNLGLTVEGAAWLQKTAKDRGECSGDNKGVFCDVLPGTLYNPNAAGEDASNLLLYYPPTEQVPSSTQEGKKVPMFGCTCGIINNIPSAQMPGDPYSCYIDPCYYAIGNSVLNGCKLGPDANILGSPTSKQEEGIVADIMQCTAECDCMEKGAYQVPIYTLGVLEGYNMWNKKYPPDVINGDNRPEFPSSVFTSNPQAFDAQSTDYLKLISDMEDFGVKKNDYAGLCSPFDFCNTGATVGDQFTDNPVENYNLGDTIGPYTWPGIGQCNCGDITEPKANNMILRDCFSDYNKNFQGDLTLNGQINPNTHEPEYVLMEPCINPYNPIGVECYEPADIIECAHNGSANAMASTIAGTGPFKAKTGKVVKNDGTEVTAPPSGFNVDTLEESYYYNWNYKDTAASSSLWWATGMYATWCNCSTGYFYPSATLSKGGGGAGGANAMYGQLSYNWFFNREAQLAGGSTMKDTKKGCNKGNDINDTPSPLGHINDYVFPQGTTAATCNAFRSGEDGVCTEVVGAVGSWQTNAFACTDAQMRTWPTIDISDNNPLNSVGGDVNTWGSPNLNTCFWTQSPSNFKSFKIPDQARGVKKSEQSKCIKRIKVDGIQSVVTTDSNLGAGYTEPNIGGKCNYMNYPTAFAVQLKLPQAVFQTPLYWGEDGPLEQNTKFSTYGTGLENSKYTNNGKAVNAGGAYTEGEVAGRTFLPDSSKSLEAKVDSTPNRGAGDAGLRPLWRSSGWCGDGTVKGKVNKKLDLSDDGNAKAKKFHNQQNRNYIDWRDITGLGACFGGGDISSSVGCSGITGDSPGYVNDQNGGVKSPSNVLGGCSCKYCTSMPLPTSNPGTIAQNRNTGQCMHAAKMDKCATNSKEGRCSALSDCKPAIPGSAVKGYRKLWQPGGDCP